ncbi:MAG: hypothetical protein HYT70_00050 [Candidatus Aenigmarchaeota archaeon]|nr:hypothetical protein [Candidatus Aenigmarchaeota archaeon]
MVSPDLFELIGIDTIAGDLKRFRSSAEYFERNYQQLREQYPDMWLAVQEREVVAYHKTYNGLLQQLDMDVRKSVYVNRTYTGKQPTIILSAA